MIKITWSNSKSLDGIYYDSGFTNQVYFNAELKTPEYSIDVESSQNEKGEVIDIFKRLVKRYKFVVYVQEYMVDALTLMQMHDNIHITYLGQTWKMKEIIVSPEWDKIDQFARVEISFSIDYITVGQCEEEDPGAINVVGAVELLPRTDPKYEAMEFDYDTQILAYDTQNEQYLINAAVEKLQFEWIKQDYDKVLVDTGELTYLDGNVGRLIVHINDVMIAEGEGYDLTFSGYLFEEYFCRLELKLDAQEYVTILEGEASLFNDSFTFNVQESGWYYAKLTAWVHGSEIESKEKYFEVVSTT